MNVDQKMETDEPNLELDADETNPNVDLVKEVDEENVNLEFSKLKQVKNFLGSTMTQGRLVDLARLTIEAELARKVNFDEVIRRFERRKTRKAPLFSRR